MEHMCDCNSIRLYSKTMMALCSNYDREKYMSNIFLQKIIIYRFYTIEYDNKNSIRYNK